MDIHDCCENGSVHMVIDLLTSNKATLSDRDEIGNTPLHNACLGAQVSLVALFLGQPITYQHLAEDNENTATNIICGKRELAYDEVTNYKLPKKYCIKREELSAGSKLYRDDYGSTPL
tara:strand:+ start:36 stop:389 length:354 start_codon:yes stop_codon:yes gene_type:complete